jgi:hypothetical protein
MCRESQEAYERKDHKFVLLTPLLLDYIQLGGLMLTPIIFVTLNYRKVPSSFLDTIIP